MAVFFLVAIAGILAWGTIYETRFGTASVQRFIYQSAWFQGLLAFLAVNLAAAAFSRRPWKRKHVPFLLAHLGIILVLAGGIVGGRLGIEGQLLIPEGESNSTLQLSGNVLVVHQPNPGIHREFVTRFETTSWNHRPHALFDIPLKDRSLHLVVDRYYPNAERHEEVTERGEEENPAVRLALSHEGREDSVWLFARDPDRFGVRWGDAHVFLLEPQTQEELRRLLEPAAPDPKDRGVIRIGLPDLNLTREISVPRRMNRPVPLHGTHYTATFKEFFSDFALSGNGPVNRSSRPDNPAVALTLSGPEGTDAHLLFALHPEFAALHGRRPKIHSHLLYQYAARDPLPPDSIGLIWLEDGTLAAVLTDNAGRREKIQPLRPGDARTHPGLGYRFEVTDVAPRAKREEHFENRDNEVRREALHVTASDGGKTAEAWLALRESTQLAIGQDQEHDPLVVEYRPAARELPFSVRLLDFRKIDYPGTQMAAGFESDVELTDPERGVSLKRTIRMNNPLKYRGFVLFQSSFIQGPVEIPPFGGTSLDRSVEEATVLSVRNDPGTPLVYTGFLIIVAGVTAMFILRPYRRPAGDPS